MRAIDYNIKKFGTLWKVSDLPEDFDGRAILYEAFINFSQAVRWFQEKSGLAADGMLGPATLFKLTGQKSSKTPSSHERNDQNLAKLATCHPNLQRLFREVMEICECLVVEGHRSHERQIKLVAAGRSRTMNSKHLHQPSLAVDVTPWPLDYDDYAQFITFGHLVKDIAAQLHISLTWGGDWKTFKDYSHFELRR